MSVRDGAIEISVTDDRAKTRNLRRDPRAVIHVSTPDTWSYASFDGTVEVSNVTTDPNDDVADALCELYERIAGSAHDNWQEFRAAMVSEKRCIIRFTPASVTGQVH